MRKVISDPASILENAAEIIENSADQLRMVLEVLGTDANNEKLISHQQLIEMEVAAVSLRLLINNITPPQHILI